MIERGHHGEMLPGHARTLAMNAWSNHDEDAGLLDRNAIWRENSSIGLGSLDWEREQRRARDRQVMADMVAGWTTPGNISRRRYGDVAQAYLAWVHALCGQLDDVLSSISPMCRHNVNSQLATPRGCPAEPFRASTPKRS
jgi:hypothetical protein